jgi:hypothetical protein
MRTLTTEEARKKFPRATIGERAWIHEGAWIGKGVEISEGAKISTGERVHVDRSWDQHDTPKLNHSKALENVMVKVKHSETWTTSDRTEHSSEGTALLHEIDLELLTGLGQILKELVPDVNLRAQTANFLLKNSAALETLFVRRKAIIESFEELMTLKDAVDRS